MTQSATPIVIPGFIRKLSKKYSGMNIPRTIQQPRKTQKMTMNNNQNRKYELMKVQLNDPDPVFEVWREDGQFNERVATFYIPGMGDEYVKAMNTPPGEIRKLQDQIIELQDNLAHMEQNSGEAKLLALRFKQELTNLGNAASAFLGTIKCPQEPGHNMRSWLGAELDETKELLNQ